MMSIYLPLRKFPKLFSLGFASHEGPTEQTMENAEFAIYFSAEGWDKEEKLLEPNDQYKSPPSKRILTKVSGTNPGYGATCVALVLSATTILKENDKMPGRYELADGAGNMYHNLHFNYSVFSLAVVCIPPVPRTPRRA